LLDIIIHQLAAMGLVLALRILPIIEAARATHPMEHVLRIKELVYLLQITQLVIIHQLLAYIQQAAVEQYL
jgi:hypothetical protein